MLIQMWNSDWKPERERTAEKMEKAKRQRQPRPLNSSLHLLSSFWLLTSICLSCESVLQTHSTLSTFPESASASTVQQQESSELITSQNVEPAFTGESHQSKQSQHVKLFAEMKATQEGTVAEDNLITQSDAKIDNIGPTKFSTHATTIKTRLTTTTIAAASSEVLKNLENPQTSLSPPHPAFSPVKPPSIKIEGTALSTNTSSEGQNKNEEIQPNFSQVDKSSNMNILRKLWSSTRTGKLNLNLTHEHESILRIENLKNKPAIEYFTTPSTTSVPSDATEGAQNQKESENEIAEIPELKTKTTFLTIPMVDSQHHSNNNNDGGHDVGKAGKDEKFKFRNAMLYPEWLSSSGGVYPDDNNNFTGDYYTDQAAYEHEHEHDHEVIASPSSSPSEKPVEEPKVAINNVNNDLDREESGDLNYQSSTQNLRKRINDEILARIINKTTPSVISGGSVMLGSSFETKEKANSKGKPSSINYNLKVSEDKVDAGGSPLQSQNKIQNQNSNVNGGDNNLKLLQELESGSSFESSSSNGLLTASMGSSNGPQSGLADVISRGRIDSVMYVYFGDKFNDYHKEEVAGRIIQAVGGVVAAIAQVLTVLGAAKCVRRVTHSQSLPVHLHIGFALLLSNLLLLLAVHATEPLDVCASVALILHYLHLVIGCWLFAHTLQTYRALCRHVAAPTLLSPDAEQDQHSSGAHSFRTVKPSTLRYSIAAWTAPVPFLIMSYILNPNGYETHRYCWMSIEKGMVISFIVPIFFLIGLNTFLVVLSLRHLLALRKLWEDASMGEVDEDTLDGKIISSGIRASAMLLPLLAIMWFLGVVALENSTSIFFQLAATTANIALSWLVLYFLGEDVWPETWCALSKLDRTRRDSSLYEDALNSSVQPSSAQLSFDNEPLLTAAAPVPSTSSQLSSAAASGSFPTMTGGGSGGNGYASSSHKIALNSTASSASSSTGHGGGGGCGSGQVTLGGGSGGHQSGHGGGGGGGGKHHPPTPSSSSSHPSTSSAISPNSSRWPKTSSSHRPNWSRPGGNEIYELRHDAISTIYK